MGYDYNEISKVYDNVRAAEFEVVKFIMEKAKINEQSCVLEIGCGTANYLMVINQLTHARVWGVDQSSGMLSKAMEKCSEGTFIEDNAEELAKIPDGKFDVVYMVDVIHHIRDINKMVKSINRVLKKNGILIIFSDNHEHIRNRLTSKYFPETLEYELKRYQDTSEIIESLSKGGYRNMENGVLEIESDADYGQRLIEIASKRGYSMFGALTDDEINKGIERIEADLAKGPIMYYQGATYVIGIK